MTTRLERCMEKIKVGNLGYKTYNAFLACKTLIKDNIRKKDGWGS